MRCCEIIRAVAFEGLVSVFRDYGVAGEGGEPGADFLAVVLFVGGAVEG